jgi:hypothetical protein
MEHKYAQVLRWIADGKKVQAMNMRAEKNGWCDFPWDFNERALSTVLKGLDLIDEYAFRLAPRTVKVGDVEIEAPLQGGSHGSTAYYTNAHGRAVSFDLEIGDAASDGLLRGGRLFSTPESAKAAHAAWVKLMTQGEA